MEKQELIDQIAYIMEHGSPETGSRTEHCQRLLDDYVEQKIEEHLEEKWDKIREAVKVYSSSKSEED